MESWNGILATFPPVQLTLRELHGDFHEKHAAYFAGAHESVLILRSFCEQNWQGCPLRTRQNHLSLAEIWLDFSYEDETPLSCPSFFHHTRVLIGIETNTLSRLRWMDRIGCVECIDYNGFSDLTAFGCLIACKKVDTQQKVTESIAIHWSTGSDTSGFHFRE
jgi:hypothetical protein